MVETSVIEEASSESSASATTIGGDAASVLAVLLMVIIGYVIYKCCDDADFRWRVIIGVSAVAIIILALEKLFS